jgi:ethanolamine ammonia-lyase small subunit
MGAYLTWQPGPHTTDANRNCISNIRPEGIDPVSAARKIMQLIRAMRARQMSGVALKDETERRLIDDIGRDEPGNDKREAEDGITVPRH